MSDETLEEFWAKMMKIAYGLPNGPEMLFRGVTDESYTLVPSIGRDTAKDCLNNAPNARDFAACSPKSRQPSQNSRFFLAARRVFPSSGRTYPAAGINRRRDIHKFDSANSVNTCAVFFDKPRYRTFT